MNFLRSLLLNFLVIFFADYLLPGIAVVDQTKLPHIGGDLLFPVVLGVLNASIFPLLKMIDRHLTAMRIATIALILNFAAYALLKALSLGVQVMTVEGYILAAVVVACGSFATNYWALKRHGHRGDINRDEGNPPQ